MLKLKNLFRPSLAMAALALVVFGMAGCNSQNSPEETAIQINNPAVFGSDIHSAKVNLVIGTQSFLLFEGTKTDVKFSGPWSVVLPETEIESMTLNMVGFDVSNNQRLKLQIVYRVVGSKLVPDTTVQFYSDSAIASTAAGTFNLSYLALPSSMTPQITLSNPSLASLELPKTLRLLSTGVLQVIIASPDFKFSDTLTLTISSDAIIPDPDPDPVKPVTPDSIRLSRDSLALFQGIDEYPISWTTYPASFQNQVSCISTNAASVSMKGVSLIVPVSVGESRIICSIANSQHADTLLVQVKDVANPTTPLDSIRLDRDSLTLFTDKPGVQLGYTVYPATQQIETLWSVSTAIASVSATGLVTPRTTGTGWVLLIGIGSQVVKDSLHLTVLDTTTKPAQWKRDTLFAQVYEGQSLSIRLSDSISNPSAVAVEFIKPSGNARFSLTSATLGFTAGANDSGDHYQAISMIQGDRIANVVMHVRVLPVYFTLSTQATNGVVTVIPVKAKYRLGERVTVLPAAADGFVFSSWSGDATGTANPLEILMNKNQSVTAIFTAGSSSTCTEVANGASLNTAIRQGYQSTSQTTTLCPVPNGRFDGNTIQALGKINIILTR